MPPLPYFLGGQAKLPLVIQWDGIGFGKQQFNTVEVCNPYAPKSAQMLRLLGLRNCGDNREGTPRPHAPPTAHRMYDHRGLVTRSSCMALLGEPSQLVPSTAPLLVGPGRLLHAIFNLSFTHRTRIHT